MRRSGYMPRADFQLELTRKPERRAKRARRCASRARARRRPGRLRDAALTPDVDFAASRGADGRGRGRRRHLGGRRPAEHQSRARGRRGDPARSVGQDRFALVAPISTPRCSTRRRASPRRRPRRSSNALERARRRTRPAARPISGAIFEPCARARARPEQPAIVYIGDGLATSGEIDGRRAGRAPAAVADRLARALLHGRRRARSRRRAARPSSRAPAAARACAWTRARRRRSCVRSSCRARSRPRRSPTSASTSATASTTCSSAPTGKLSRGEELRPARAHAPRAAQDRHDPRPPRRRELRARVRGRARQGAVPRAWSRGCGPRRISSDCSATRAGPRPCAARCSRSALEYGLMTPFTLVPRARERVGVSRAGIERRSRAFPILTDAYSACRRGPPSCPSPRATVRPSSRCSVRPRRRRSVACPDRSSPSARAPPTTTPATRVARASRTSAHARRRRVGPGPRPRRWPTDGSNPRPSRPLPPTIRRVGQARRDALGGRRWDRCDRSRGRRHPRRRRPLQAARRRRLGRADAAGLGRGGHRLRARAWLVRWTHSRHAVADPPRADALVQRRVDARTPASAAVVDAAARIVNRR